MAPLPCYTNTKPSFRGILRYHCMLSGLPLAEQIGLTFFLLCICKRGHISIDTSRKRLSRLAVPTLATSSKRQHFIHSGHSQIIINFPNNLHLPLLETFFVTPSTIASNHILMLAHCSALTPTPTRRSGETSKKKMARDLTRQGDPRSDRGDYRTRAAMVNRGGQEAASIEDGCGKIKTLLSTLNKAPVLPTMMGFVKVLGRGSLSSVRWWRILDNSFDTQPRIGSVLGKPINRPVTLLWALHR